MLHRHFDGEPASDFAVIDIEGPHFGFTLRDGDVTGAIMTHQHDVLIKIECVIFGERAAGTEAVHDLHCLRVFDFQFARDGNAARRQQ